MDRFTIYKPLVVVVVIGDYHESPLPSIKSALNDYHNVVYAFNYIRGYDIVFATTDGIKHLTNENRVTSANEICSFDFKLQWDDTDIDAFNKHVAEETVSCEDIIKAAETINCYDSLIYILSAHGDGKQIIYGSNGDEISIQYTVCFQFNNKNCKSLRQLPKIYMFDINRYGSDTLASSNSQLQSNINSNNINNFTHSLESNSPTACLPVLNTKTYTQESHCYTIYGNSKQQPSPLNVPKTNCSLFISGITKVVRRNFTFVNSNLRDVVFETRQHMANVLSVPEKGIQTKLDDIVLIEQSTMPYEINFASSALIDTSSKDEKESKTDVCFSYLVSMYLSY